MRAQPQEDLMRPIPGADEPGETLDDRIRNLLARAREQRAKTTEQRRQMAIRRAYGLRRRHQNKTQRNDDT